MGPVDRELWTLNANPENLNPGHGVTDFSIADRERVRIIVESKSTHSLPLPMDAREVIRRFKNGRMNAVSKDRRVLEGRGRDKLHVADTIGLLLRYMLINGCRYGDLTSGTRTSFFYLRDDNSGKMAENVFVSGAWFVGEKNYL